MLMRYWTLYDSMYYSNYIGPKLNTTTDAGKKDLGNFTLVLIDLLHPAPKAGSQF